MRYSSAGHELYRSKATESNPLSDQLNLVPTFGLPPTYYWHRNGLAYPSIPIGRIAAVIGAEVSSYLQKVIEYEQEQNTPGSTVSDKFWLKEMIHVAGGKG